MLAKLGRYEESLQDVNRAIELEPAYKYCYGTRGQTHFLMEKYDAALADFEKAEELKPGDAYALIGQAVTHYALGNMDTTKDCWQKALEEESKYADVQTFIDEFDHAEGFANAVREVALLDTSTA